MAKEKITWAVRLTSGQIKGPYTTDIIIRLIQEGAISGNELISKVPYGDWINISQEPEFYDCLLDALEGKPNKENQESNEDKVEEITKSVKVENILVSSEEQKKKNKEAIDNALKSSIVHLSEIQNQNIKNNFEDNKSLVNVSSTKLSKVIAQSRSTVDLGNSSPNGKVVDLKKMSSVKKKAIAKKTQLPLILFITILFLFGAIYFYDPAPPISDAIVLLAPKPQGKPALTNPQIKEKKGIAIRYIEQDNTDSYIAAENTLVSLVEGAPLDLEARGLLCMVYKELWPFAKQDVNDQKVIAYVTQTTKSINIISPFGQICELVNFITSGKFKETKGLVESVLDSGEEFSLVALLYYYKAENLEGYKDYPNAGPYYEKAAQIWPTWSRPKVALGAMYFNSGMKTEGYTIFSEILKKNPQHKLTQVYIGLYEYFVYKRNDQAFGFLNVALQSKTKIDKLADAKAHYALSMLYLDRNDKKMALSLAEKAYKLNPTNLDYKQLVVKLGGKADFSDKAVSSDSLYVADQYARQGDWLSAQAEYKAAFDADPKNGIAAMKAGKALWQLNQSTEAINWLKKAIKAQPRLVSAYVLLSDYLSQQYDLNQARTTIMTAIKIDSKNYEALRGLALLELRSNLYVNAINTATRAMQIYNADVDTYVILAKANLKLALEIIGNSKEETEKKQNATRDSIRFATKATEIDGAHVEAQITYANVLSQTSGVDVGIAYLNDLIKKYSFSYEYRLALADMNKQEERHTVAQQIYSQIVDVDPKNKKAWIGLGQSEHALGNVDKSLAAFLKAASFDPSDVEPQLFVGELYLEKGQFKDAIQMFTKAKQNNPFFPRVNYLIGKAYMSAGKYPEALQSALEEKKAYPKLAEVHALLGEIYFAQGSYAECASSYSAALQCKNLTTGYYVKAAQCYRLSGSADIAENMLEQATARESGFAEIYREQGAIYEQRGEKQSAVVAYEKYLELSPNAPDRLDVERKLAALNR